MTEYRATYAERQSGARRHPRKPRPISHPANNSKTVVGPSAAIVSFHAMGDQAMPLMTLELSGDLTNGGFIELAVDGQKPERIQLAPPLWVFMELLINAATAAECSHWVNSYVTAAEILATLEHKGLLVNATVDAVYKVVSELRKKLDAIQVRQLGADVKNSSERWSTQIVVTSRKLGYRITLPPERLKIVPR